MKKTIIINIEHDFIEKKHLIKTIRINYNIINFYSSLLRSSVKNKLLMQLYSILLKVELKL